MEFLSQTLLIQIISKSYVTINELRELLLK